MMKWNWIKNTHTNKLFLFSFSPCNKHQLIIITIFITIVNHPSLSSPTTYFWIKIHSLTENVNSYVNKNATKTLTIYKKKSARTTVVWHRRQCQFICKLVIWVQHIMYTITIIINCHPNNRIIQVAHYYSTNHNNIVRIIFRLAVVYQRLHQIIY